MNRRRLLAAGLSMAASLLADHTAAMADLEPDGKWPLYRRHALFIVGQRVDETADAIVDLLAHALPQLRARLALASDARRIGVLIGTNQQDVAVMKIEDAEALYLARAPFADIRDLPLRAIVSLGNRLLVCRADFPPRTGFLLAQALVGHGKTLPSPAQAPEGRIPAQVGARAFFAGEAVPA